MGIGTQCYESPLIKMIRRAALKLAGKLCAPWGAETKDAWRSSPCLGKQIEVEEVQEHEHS
jgi:hypothetical protein